MTNATTTPLHDAPVVASVRVEVSGQRRYVIRRQLGSGGMAEVLEAMAVGEHGLRRKVAIKRLRPEHAGDASFVRMFLDEARLASELHHAGIVAVHDYGVLDGIPFQVLEFVDGRDVRTLGARGRAKGVPMPVEIALSIALDIAHALHHAHTHHDEQGAPRGLVHRDVKPANILVSWAGDVKLGDFGIAFAHRRAEKTMAGQTKGTPGYMAPEQILSTGVDARTDVFSLGCCLHAMVAGDSPISNHDHVLRLLTGNEVALAPNLPPDIAAIITRAVRHAPEERFATAAEMAAALGSALALRLAGDRKSALLLWLARVKEDESAQRPPARGKFDALLGAEIAPSPDATEPHRFETTMKGDPPPFNAVAPDPLVALQNPRSNLETAERTRDAAGESGSAHVEDGPEDSLRLPTHELPAWMRAGAVAAGSALLMGAGYFAYTHRPASPASVNAPSPVTANSAAPSESPVAPLPALVESAESTGRREHLEATPRNATHPHPSPSPAARAAASGETPATPPNTLVSTGTLAVGGPSPGARIFVDGRLFGYAPKYVDLPLGTHRIELVASDGTRTGPTTLEIGAQHTRIAPLRWP